MMQICFPFQNNRHREPIIINPQIDWDSTPEWVLTLAEV